MAAARGTTLNMYNKIQNIQQRIMVVGSPNFKNPFHEFRNDFFKDYFYLTKPSNIGSLLIDEFGISTYLKLFMYNLEEEGTDFQKNCNLHTYMAKLDAYTLLTNEGTEDSARAIWPYVNTLLITEMIKTRLDEIDITAEDIKRDGIDTWRNQANKEIIQSYDLKLRENVQEDMNWEFLDNGNTEPVAQNRKECLGKAMEKLSQTPLQCMIEFLQTMAAIRQLTKLRMKDEDIDYLNELPLCEYSVEEGFYTYITRMQNGKDNGVLASHITYHEAGDPLCEDECKHNHYHMMIYTDKKRFDGCSFYRFMDSFKSAAGTKYMRTKKCHAPREFSFYMTWKPRVYLGCSHSDYLPYFGHIMEPSEEWYTNQLIKRQTKKRNASPIKDDQELELTEDKFIALIDKFGTTNKHEMLNLLREYADNKGKYEYLNWFKLQKEKDPRMLKFEQAVATWKADLDYLDTTGSIARRLDMWKLYNNEIASTNDDSRISIPEQYDESAHANIYETLNKIVNIIDKCTMEYLDKEGKMQQTTDTVFIIAYMCAILLKQTKKINGIIFEGPPNCGKSAIATTLANAVDNIGAIGISTNPQFAFADIPKKHVVLHEEPVISPLLVEPYKLLLGGDHLMIEMKGRNEKTRIYKTPVLITTNKTVWYYCTDAKPAIQVRTIRLLFSDSDVISKDQKKFNPCILGAWLDYFTIRHCDNDNNAIDPYNFKDISVDDFILDITDSIDNDYYSSGKWNHLSSGQFRRQTKSVEQFNWAGSGPKRTYVQNKGGKRDYGQATTTNSSYGSHRRFINSRNRQND